MMDFSSYMLLRIEPPQALPGGGPILGAYFYHSFVRKVRDLAFLIGDSHCPGNEAFRRPRLAPKLPSNRQEGGLVRYSDPDPIGQGGGRS